MYAVISAGGKQHKVAAGDVIDVDRLRCAPGDTVSFKALLVVDGASVRATPSDLEGLTVSAEVLAHKRGRKIRVFNYHAKTGWKRTKGHRAELTTVRIGDIGVPAKPETMADSAPGDEVAPVDAGGGAGAEDQAPVRETVGAGAPVAGERESGDGA